MTAGATTIDDLIAEATRLVEMYRARGLHIDAAAARIRLQALKDARRALEAKA